MLRELAEVDARPGVRCELFSLFPERGGPGASGGPRAGSARRRRASPAGAARAPAYWAARRPLRLAGVVSAVLRDYARRPRVLPRALVAVACALQHARTLRAEPVDHLHAHFATYPALAAWTCSRLVGVPYSFTAHAHDLFVHRWGCGGASRTPRSVSASRSTTRASCAPRRARSADVHVVHCGVHPESLRVSAARAASRRADARRVRRGPQGRTRAIACCSTRSAASLDEGRAVELELVGDGPLRAEPRKAVRSAGSRRSRPLPRSLTEPEVAGVLDRADVFALASVVQRDGDTDGIPVALMEAMAAGLPVVASAVSGRARARARRRDRAADAGGRPRRARRCAAQRAP